MDKGMGKGQGQGNVACACGKAMWHGHGIGAWNKGSGQVNGAGDYATSIWDKCMGKEQGQAELPGQEAALDRSLDRAYLEFSFLTFSPHDF